MMSEHIFPLKAIELLIAAGAADATSARRELTYACARGRVDAWASWTRRNLFGDYRQSSAAKPEKMISLTWRDALVVQGFESDLPPLAPVTGWMSWEDSILSLFRPHGFDGDQQVLWTGILFNRAGVETIADEIVDGGSASSEIATQDPTTKYREAVRYLREHPMSQNQAEQRLKAVPKFSGIKRKQVRAAWSEVRADEGKTSASDRTP